MEQIHRRFTTEQVKALLKGYVKKNLERREVEEVLGIGKARFFSLLREYRDDPEGFSVEYRRSSPARIPAPWEKGIARAILEEKELIDNPALPITTYNYSAVRDRLAGQGIEVSLPTIIDRAKGLGCHKPRKKKKAHEREVVTAAVGALIQHDASHHLWSPYALEKWALITSLDDFSRLLLYADFWGAESSWAHIRAAEDLTRRFGIPLRYYVDSLSVFRYVKTRDSVWRRHVALTDDVDPQWKKVMRVLGVEVVYALSPQAKGKVERPYRWLQDRIVRTCAREKLSTMEEVRAVLREEVDRYNNRQVHSTTGEIPAVRFRKALSEGNSLFRPLAIPKPYSLSRDVFCLRERRMVNSYRKIEIHKHDIPVPGVTLHDEVDVHLIPDVKRGAMELRIWWGGKMVKSVAYPLGEFPRVHF
ncbi:MAG: hypothetical protein ACOC78_00140 [Actinomycetota bacterium]